MSLRNRIMGSLALVLAASWLSGQVWVNTQVNMRAPVQVTGNPNGSIRYSPQVKLLGSEERYATWRSGALPSEIRMAAAAAGPLSPSGSIAYVPGPSPTQQAMRLPSPQLYNPAYGINSGGGGGTPVPPPIPLSSIAPASVRYASPAPNSISTAINPVPLTTGFNNTVAPPVVGPPSIKSVGGDWMGKPAQAWNIGTAPPVQLAPTAYPSGLNTGSIRYSGMAPLTQ